MSFEIPNRFTPAESEPELFKQWESAGAFSPTGTLLPAASS